MNDVDAAADSIHHFLPHLWGIGMETIIRFLCGYRVTDPEESAFGSANISGSGVWPQINEFNNQSVHCSVHISSIYYNDIEIILVIQVGHTGLVNYRFSY